MKKTVARILAISLAMVLVLCACTDSSSTPSSSGEQTSSPSASTFTLTYRSGATGGCFYPVSAAMAEFLPNYIDGLSGITVTPGTGQANIQAIQDKECDIAFAKLPGTIQAINGEAPFEAPCGDVANMMYFYDESFHFVVLADTGIETFEDLPGHSLATQTVGNQAEQMTREVLEAYGLSYDDFSSLTQVNDYNDAIEMMKNGQVEAFTFANAIPVTLLTDLSSVRDIRILSLNPEALEYVLSCNDGYVASTIPAGTYAGQEEDVQTFGGAIHVICNKDMDEELVYQIVKYTCENLTTIQNCHATFSNLTVDQMGQQLALDFHPGAARYFREIGVLK